MIGRGTRLCPDLFGPGDDKHDFRVFDFCFNFDFFREHPEGIEASGDVSLRARLFRSRVQLLTDVQAPPDLDPEAALAWALTTELHREVAAMNRENFIVRMQLEAVERFQQRESWERLRAPVGTHRVADIAKRWAGADPHPLRRGESAAKR